MKNDSLMVREVTHGLSNHCFFLKKKTMNYLMELIFVKLLTKILEPTSLFWKPAATCPENKK